MRKRVLVTGAGGFIGHHLAGYLKNQGYWVRGVDIKEPEFEPSAAAEFKLLDLRRLENCLAATLGVDQVYNLAADMGGVGYNSAFLAEITKNNTMINVHMLEASRLNGIQRFFFSSSACIYPQHLQKNPNVTPLKEEDAYPADAEEGYGWEKLFMEKMCSYYRKDYGLQTRVARFHNVYGPFGTYEGGKEKSPAAICRKVALARDGEEIEVWGDGEQTRSYMYIDDCVQGIYRLMCSDYHHPLNLGTDKLISVNQLVDIISKIAGKSLIKRHDLSKPQGVRGRNSDNTRLREALRWEPKITLGEGLIPAYRWIESQVQPSPELQPRKMSVGV